MASIRNTTQTQLTPAESFITRSRTKLSTHSPRYNFKFIYCNTILQYRLLKHVNLQVPYKLFQHVTQRFVRKTNKEKTRKTIFEYKSTVRVIKETNSSKLKKSMTLQPRRHHIIFYFVGFFLLAVINTFNIKHKVTVLQQSVISVHFYPYCFRNKDYN